MTYDFCSMLMLYIPTHNFVSFFNACVDIILWAALVIISAFMRRFSYVSPDKRGKIWSQGSFFNGGQKGNYKRESTKDVRGNNI